MAKRAVIIHGWEGHPGEAWFPWLKQELEKKGFSVEVPAMPDTDHPKIEAWVPALAKVVGTPDKETFLIGHSIGCQTILRYLETIDAQIGGAVLVAGFFTLNEEMREKSGDKEVDTPWLETPIDYEKVKKATENIVAIFSDTDPWVPLENVKMHEERVGAKTIVLKGKGHMGGSDKCFELPEALNAVVEMAGH